MREKQLKAFSHIRVKVECRQVDLKCVLHIDCLLKSSI